MLNRISFIIFFISFSFFIFSQSTSSFGNYTPPYDLRSDKLFYQSFYIEMDDQEKIATDVFLPKDFQEVEKLPTILYLTRYIRTLEGKWFIKPLKDPIFGQVSEAEVKYWTAHGYAVVLVDVRGTGASTGVREMEFSPREIKDGALVVDWITEQTWSNEKVGVTGISYLGTTAELLLVNQHPAVKACIPRSNIVDLYDHITYPGGLPHAAFIEVWRDLTLSLDTGFIGIAGKQAEMLVKGAKPVMGDKRRRVFKEAQADHKQNFDIFSALFEVDFKDELHPDLAKPISTFSISSYLEEISNSETPIYRIDGWWDGALAKSAIYGYLATSNSQKLLLGPWDHGPSLNISPFAESNKVKFPIKEEMLRFFDYHIKGIETNILKDKPIHYYTMGQEKWKSSDVWPPAQTEMDTLFLSQNKSLKKRAEKINGESNYVVDYSVGSGDAAGWNSMTGTYRLGGDISYPDRAEVNTKMEVFTSDPLKAPLEITGHPIVDLYMSVPTTDGAVFVYLEAVSPEGYVQYITEGELRLIHKKVSPNEELPILGPYHSYKMADQSRITPDEVFLLSIEMIPTSYEVPKGHSIRLSIAGSDVDHFSYTEIKPKTMTFYFEEDIWSQIHLPIIR